MILTADHNARLARARCSLDGLSVGDAFGERFFGAQDEVEARIAARQMPPPTWGYTDDTEMALGVVEVLSAHGAADEDALASVFAKRWAGRPNRGYGAMARQILQAIRDGTPWSEASAKAFGGEGSLGNGSAMRVAPLGAYFADDPDLAAREAVKSARVTHSDPEGLAGAIAVAVATALAARGARGEELLRAVRQATPPGETQARLTRALTIRLDNDPRTAASFLGNGTRVTCPDTVPFAVWCAAKHTDNFVEAMWTTVAGLGDRDTTCAIVGGIVGAACPKSIPASWIQAREVLK